MSLATPQKTTPSSSIKDFFSGILKSSIPGISSPVGITGFSPTTNNLPNGGGTYQSVTTNKTSTPPAVQGPTVIPPTNTPPTGGKTLFSGGTPASTTSPTQLDYSKYTNPTTGQPYTPQEYADVVAKKVSGGDVASYAGDTITQPNMSAEDLKKKVTDLNNNRNDIAVGDADPYKVGADSGIQYTPAQLSAIEKAYAGIYDPALKDVFAKLDAKQKKDDEESALKQKLAEMAQQHQYDLELKRTPSGDTTTNSNDYIYIPGSDTVVDSYVSRLNNGDLTETDLLKYLPGVANTGLRNKITQALNQTRQNSSKSGQNLDLVNNINTLLSNPDLASISGPLDQFTGGQLGNAKDAKTTYNYIKDNLALIKAQTALKGQGQISDFERKILDNASSVVSRGQGDDNFKNSLIQVKGALLSSSGIPTPVQVTNKDGNKTIQQLDTNGIRDAIRNGSTIKYVADDTTKSSSPSYTIGQVITGGDGKKYKITGLSNPNDPDIEPVK